MKEPSGLLTLLKTSPGTSIQDLGRKNWTQFGVPVSGQMDKISAEWANHILQNDPNDAVLEISQPGLKLGFSLSTEISWAGAQAQLLLNGNLISQLQKIRINAGDNLEVGAFGQGAILYLAIREGFQSPKVLGSRSFYPKITPTQFLQKNDQIPYSQHFPAKSPAYSLPKWDLNWFQKENLEFYPGPDFSLLTEAMRHALLENTFTLSQARSRMGVILLESLENNLPELPTNPVYPGTVQLTSGGKLIILGPDAQVTGGYPRIMLLTEFAQAVLAQKKPGLKVRFSKIEI